MHTLCLNHHSCRQPGRALGHTQHKRPCSTHTQLYGAVTGGLAGAVPPLPIVPGSRKVAEGLSGTFRNGEKLARPAHPKEHCKYAACSSKHCGRDDQGETGTSPRRHHPPREVSTRSTSKPCCHHNINANVVAATAQWPVCCQPCAHGTQQQCRTSAACTPRCACDTGGRAEPHKEKETWCAHTGTAVQDGLCRQLDCVFVVGCVSTLLRTSGC